jgi:hypothetical protein
MKKILILLVVAIFCILCKPDKIDTRGVWVAVNPTKCYRSINMMDLTSQSINTFFASKDIPLHELKVMHGPNDTLKIIDLEEGGEYWYYMLKKVNKKKLERIWFSSNGCYGCKKYDMNLILSGSAICEVNSDGLYIKKIPKDTLKKFHDFFNYIDVDQLSFNMRYDNVKDGEFFVMILEYNAGSKIIYGDVNDVPREFWPLLELSFCFIESNMGLKVPGKVFYSKSSFVLDSIKNSYGDGL